VETKDISRITLGNSVVMKLESLPYQQYGSLEGRLVSLTPDTLPDKDERSEQLASSMSFDQNDVSHGRTYYRAEISITRSALRNLPQSFMLRSGMKVTADIKVGTRSVVQYILNPLTRSLNESMREP
jgi:hemolysin D